MPGVDDLIRDIAAKQGKQVDQAYVDRVKDYYGGDYDQLIRDVAAKQGKQVDDAYIGRVRAYYGLGDDNEEATIQQDASAEQPRQDVASETPEPSPEPARAEGEEQPGRGNIIQRAIRGVRQAFTPREKEGRDPGSGPGEVKAAGPSGSPSAQRPSAPYSGEQLEKNKQDFANIQRRYEESDAVSVLERDDKTAPWSFDQSEELLAGREISLDEPGGQPTVSEMLAGEEEARQVRKKTYSLEEGFKVDGERVPQGAAERHYPIEQFARQRNFDSGREASEALIDESKRAKTAFGDAGAMQFLGLTDRKAAWLQADVNELNSLIERRVGENPQDPMVPVLRQELSEKTNALYGEIAKRNKWIDKEIAKLEQTLEDGYRLDRSRPAFAAGRYSSGVSRVELTDEDRRDIESRIQLLSQRKGLVFGDPESERQAIDTQLENNSNDILSLMDKGLIPKDATPWEAIQAYYLYTYDAWKAAQADDRNRTYAGRVVENVLIEPLLTGRSEREQEYDELGRRLVSLAPIAFLNRTNLNERETALNVLMKKGGRAFQQRIQQSPFLGGPTKQEIAADTEAAISEIGIDRGAVSTGYKHHLADTKSEYGNWSAKAFLDIAGTSAEYVAPTIAMSFGVGAGLRATGLGRDFVRLSTKTSALSNAETALGRWLLKNPKAAGVLGPAARVAKQGAEWAAIDAVNDDLDSELFFGAGIASGIGGESAEAAVRGLYGLFGKRTPIAVRMISDYLGSISAEIAQETGEEVAQTIRDKDLDTAEILAGMFSGGEAWNEFKGAMKEKFPTADEAVWFAASVGAMAAMMNGNALFKMFDAKYRQELADATEEQRRQIEEITNEAVSRPAAEAAEEVVSAMRDSKEPAKAALKRTAKFQDATYTPEMESVLSELTEQDLIDSPQGQAMSEAARNMYLNQNKAGAIESAKDKARKAFLYASGKISAADYLKMVAPKAASASMTKEEVKREADAQAGFWLDKLSAKGVDVASLSAQSKPAGVAGEGGVVPNYREVKANTGVTLGEYIESNKESLPAGDVYVNGESAEPGRELRKGDVITFGSPVSNKGAERGVGEEQKTESDAEEIRAVRQEGEGAEQQQGQEQVEPLGDMPGEPEEEGGAEEKGEVEQPQQAPAPTVEPEAESEEGVPVLYRGPTKYQKINGEWHMVPGRAAENKTPNRVYGPLAAELEEEWQSKQAAAQGPAGSTTSAPPPVEPDWDGIKNRVGRGADQLSRVKREVVDRIRSAWVALKSLEPDAEIIVAETRREYEAALRDRFGYTDEKIASITSSTGQMSGGEFLYDGDRVVAVVYNLQDANRRTAGHEIAHAAILKAFMADPDILFEMVSRLYGSLTSKVKGNLASFAERYRPENLPDGEWNEEMAEEFLTELQGMLQTGEAKLFKSFTDEIKAILNDIVRKITNGKVAEVFTDYAKTEDVIRFMEDLATGIKEGRDISGTVSEFSKKSQRLKPDIKKQVEAASKTRSQKPRKALFDVKPSKNKRLKEWQDAIAKIKGDYDNASRRRDAGAMDKYRKELSDARSEMMASGDVGPISTPGDAIQYILAAGGHVTATSGNTILARYKHASRQFEASRVQSDFPAFVREVDAFLSNAPKANEITNKAGTFKTKSQRVFHGTYKGEKFKGGAQILWFTDNYLEAELYRRRAVAKSYPWFTDAVPIGFDEDHPSFSSEGTILAGDLKLNNAIDLTGFGYSIQDLSFVWDAMYQLGGVKTPWWDIDEETRRGLEEEFEGASLWQFMEKWDAIFAEDGKPVNIYENLKNEGYDGVKIIDIGPSGTQHVSYGSFGGAEFVVDASAESSIYDGIIPDGDEEMLKSAKQIIEHYKEVGGYPEQKNTSSQEARKKNKKRGEDSPDRAYLIDTARMVVDTVVTSFKRLNQAGIVLNEKEAEQHESALKLFLPLLESSMSEIESSKDLWERSMSRVNNFIPEGLASKSQQVDDNVKVVGVAMNIDPSDLSVMPGGSGAHGVVYEITGGPNKGRILKFTTDETEAIMGKLRIGKQDRRLVNIYDVAESRDAASGNRYYFLLQERLEPGPLTDAQKNTMWASLYALGSNKGIFTDNPGIERMENIDKLDLSSLNIGEVRAVEKALKSKNLTWQDLAKFKLELQEIHANYKEYGLGEAGAPAGDVHVGNLAFRGDKMVAIDVSWEFGQNFDIPYKYHQARPRTLTPKEIQKSADAIARAAADGVKTYDILPNRSPVSKQNFAITGPGAKSTNIAMRGMITGFVAKQVEKESTKKIVGINDYLSALAKMTNREVVVTFLRDEGKRPIEIDAIMASMSKKGLADMSKKIRDMTATAMTVQVNREKNKLDRAVATKRQIKSAIKAKASSKSQRPPAAFKHALGNDSQPSRPFAGVWEAHEDALTKSTVAMVELEVSSLGDFPASAKKAMAGVDKDYAKTATIKFILPTEELPAESARAEQSVIERMSEASDILGVNVVFTASSYEQMKQAMDAGYVFLYGDTGRPAEGERFSSTLMRGTLASNKPYQPLANASQTKSLLDSYTEAEQEAEIEVFGYDSMEELVEDRLQALEAFVSELDFDSWHDGENGEVELEFNDPGGSVAIISVLENLTSRYSPDWLRAVLQKYPNASANIYIETPEGGVSSEVMEDLVASADRIGANLFYRVQPVKGEGDVIAMLQEHRLLGSQVIRGVRGAGGSGVVDFFRPAGATTMKRSERLVQIKENTIFDWRLFEEAAERVDATAKGLLSKSSLFDNKGRLKGKNKRAADFDPAIHRAMDNLYEQQQDKAYRSLNLYNSISNYADEYKRLNGTGSFQSFMDELINDIGFGNLNAMHVLDAWNGVTKVMEDFGGVSEEGAMFGNELSGWDSFREIVEDRDIALKNLQELVRKQRGQLPDDWDAYTARQMERSRAAFQIKEIEEYLFGKSKWEWGYSKSTKDSFHGRLKAAGFTWDTFGLFLYAQHAIERNNRMREIAKDPTLEAPSGMSDRMAEEYIKKWQDSGQYDVLFEFAEEFRERIIKPHVQILYDNGIINEERYLALANGTSAESSVVFDHYVPLRYQEEYVSRTIGDYDRPGGHEANMIKSLSRTGGEKSLWTQRENPATTAFAALVTAIEEVERNNTKKTVAALIAGNPQTRVGVVVKPQVVVDFDEQTGRVKEIKDFTSVKIGERTYTAAFIKENSVPFKVDGKMQYLFISNRAVRTALKRVRGNTPSAVQKFISVTQFYMNFMRMVLTGGNIDFMFPNAVRDIEDAMFNISSVREDERARSGAPGDERGRTRWIRTQILGNLPRAWAAIIGFETGATKGKYVELMYEAAANGMQMSWMKYGNVQEALDIIKKHKDGFEKKDMFGDGIGGTLGYLLGRGNPLHVWPFRQVGKVILTMNSAAEQATRLSTYAALKQRFMNAGMTNDQAAKRAASIAKNITINFEKQGTATPVINGLWLFANAGIQGVARGAKTMTTKEGVAFSTAIFMASFAKEWFNEMMGDDEDDMYLYNNWIRESNFLINIPGKDPLKIPKPYSILRLWMNMGEYAYLVSSGQMSFGDAVGNTLTTLYSVTDPISGGGSVTQLFPTVFKPVFELAVNRDWKGDPIVADYYRKAADIPRYQYVNYKNPEWLKDFSEFMYEKTSGPDELGGLSISPISLQYLFNGYVGLGMVKRLQTTARETAKYFGNEEWAKLFGERSGTLTPNRNNVMIVNRFYGDVDHQLYLYKNYLETLAKDMNKGIITRQLTDEEVRNAREAYAYLKAKDKNKVLLTETFDRYLYQAYSKHNIKRIGRE